MHRCLVLDLGAGSGRAMLATMDGVLTLDEIHRFEGYAAERVDGPHWDVERLLEGVDESLRRAFDIAGSIDSVGVDSWGLDYALLGPGGERLSEPHHYRHPRSRRGHEAMPLTAGELFGASGAQDLPVNTVFQLFDESRQHPERIGRAWRLLMMADLVNHHLTGRAGAELTLARTTGLLQAGGGDWNADLCRRLGLPIGLLPPLANPGDMFGRLRPDLAGRLGLEPVPVISVASHDTASAVAALPLAADRGFVICGSWSLIGIERPAFDLRGSVHEAGFGNEGGVEGKTFLVKSLNGLHLIQKLRTHWHERTGQLISFTEIGERVREAARRNNTAAIDPSDPAFFNPIDTVEAIRSHLGKGSAAAEDIGALALAVYNGLAQEIGIACAAIESLTGAPLAGLNLCGGGAQDAVLCERIAACTGKPLRIGPIEASAWGNALLQLIGLGAIKSLEDGRRLVERSADIRDLV